MYQWHSKRRIARTRKRSNTEAEQEQALAWKMQALEDAEEGTKQSYKTSGGPFTAALVEYLVEAARLLAASPVGYCFSTCVHMSDS